MPRIDQEDHSAVGLALDTLAREGRIRSWAAGTSPNGRYRRWRITLANGDAWWVSRSELRVLFAWIEAERAVA